MNSGGQVMTVPKVLDFMAVYGSDLDDLGHSEGAESLNIGPLLAELDWQLGRLIQAAIDVGIYEETALDTHLRSRDDGLEPHAVSGGLHCDHRRGLQARVRRAG